MPEIPEVWKRKKIWNKMIVNKKLKKLLEATYNVTYYKYSVSRPDSHI